MTPKSGGKAMSETRCPTEAELLAFVDADLSPEQLRRVEQHLGSCSPCARQVSALTSLLTDLAAPLPHQFDVTEHVRSVMNRLDQVSTKVVHPHRTYWMGTLLAAAAVLVFFVFPKGEFPSGGFTARGGRAEATLARDVGVQLYVRDTSLQTLASGRRIKRTAALTAGLRNLGQKPAYLLLFAVDAQNAVHWIAPEFTVASSDPIAVSIPSSTSEQPLPNSVVFDDMAPGPLRIVALIAPKPLHVSQIELLPVADLTDAELKKRFPGSEIRQTAAEVTRE